MIVSCISVDCTWPEMFASAGWLEPLDDVYTSDELTEFSEGALQGCYVDGKLVCLPTFLNTGALLYRADLLEKYGFEPAKTWDELIEQSKVVMAGEPGVYGYAAAWQKAEALTCCTMEHIWGYDGNVLDENGNPNFDTEAVKSGISSMKKILDEGVAIDGILGMMSKDVKAAFFAGQVLYIATHRCTNQHCIIACPVLNQELGFFLMRGISRNTNVPTAIAVVLLISVCTCGRLCHFYITGKGRRNLQPLRIKAICAAKMTSLHILQFLKLSIDMGFWYEQ